MNASARRPIPTQRRIAFTLLAGIALLIGACSESNELTSAVDDSSSATGETQVSVAADARTGHYSQTTLLFDSGDGWSYEFIPAFAASASFSFGEYPDDSPPGTTQFVFTAQIERGFGGSVVGATEGRNAPNRGADYTWWFPSEQPAGQISASSIDHSLGHELTCSAASLSYETELVAEPLPKYGMTCQLSDAYQNGWIGEGFSGEVFERSLSTDETAVKSAIANMNLTEPIMIVSFFRLGNCRAFYLPDGTVSLSDSDCNLRER